MSIALLRDFTQLVDDVLWRRQVRIAHAEVNDVPSRLACCVPHRIDFGDDVGRQALDAVELVFHDLDNSMIAAELPQASCRGLRGPRKCRSRCLRTVVSRAKARQHVPGR